MRKNRPARLLILFLFIATFYGVNILFPQEPPADVQVVKGELKGAKFVIAKTTQWNKRLLIIAHGYRPVSVPLFADFPLDKAAYAGLLADGWMITCTSYRRNGLIFKEASEDILELRQYIEKEYGKPNQTIIQGISMGAVIGTLIAENPPEHVAGVLGMAFPLIEENKFYTFTYQPKIPILFFSNQDELTAPRAYIEKFKSGNGAIPPVLWRVSRDGHVNISDTEEDTALRALITLVETGKIEKNKDLTLPAPVLESGALFKDGGAYAAINDIHPIYGNITIDIVETDLNKLGLHKRASFKLIFQKKQFKVFWGNSYKDVPKGEWIAFLTANGPLEIARNFGNAARTLECKIGDNIFIEKEK